MLCGSSKIEILSSCTILVCCLARSLINARSLRQQSDASSDMDLARDPHRTARKKGSGYENASPIDTSQSIFISINKDFIIIIIIIKYQ
jgi:hypothetical protein